MVGVGWIGQGGGERESFRGRVREKGERLHTRVQSEVRRLGEEWTRKSVCGSKGQKNLSF